MWAGHPDRVPPGTLASRGLEEPAHASRGLDEFFRQFLVLAGNRFWFYILLFMYLGYRIVPYSCSVVLVFLVLAGNSFWCYVRT